MKTSISGPAYAARLVSEATAAGAQIRTNTMVTGWAGDTSLELTSPEGREVLDARAVVLATGARERARPARMIPGDRPGGVYTTGQLQNIVHLKHRGVGKRAVIVGADERGQRELADQRPDRVGVGFAERRRLVHGRQATKPTPSATVR